MRKNIKTKVLRSVLLAKINEGGVTYCPSSGKDYAMSNNIAIAPFPERSQAFEGKATRRMVSFYFRKNKDLFSKNLSFGAWYDKVSSKTYFDVVSPVPLEKEKDAIALGKDANQIAGFNLSDFSEIPLGGTGEYSPALVTPFMDRLSMALALITNK